MTTHADKMGTYRAAVGGWTGSGANLNGYYYYGAKSCWASCWYGSFDPKSQYYGGYTPCAYAIIFHEIGHAFAFDHKSGMTYGMATSFKSYIGQAKYKNDLEKVGELQAPKVFVGQEVIDKNRIKLTFYYLAGYAPYSNNNQTFIK